MDMDTHIEMAPCVVCGIDEWSYNKNRDGEVICLMCGMWARAILRKERRQGLMSRDDTHFEFGNEDAKGFIWFKGRINMSDYPTMDKYDRALLEECGKEHDKISDRLHALQHLFAWLEQHRE